MKFFVRILIIVPFLWSIAGVAQKKETRDCETNCFSAAVTSSEKISESCTTYEMKVSHDGDCKYALSHFTIAVPCGDVGGLWNSQNWKQSVGLDPTTGLQGIKIDDINEFGNQALREFTIKFTLCSN